MNQDLRHKDKCSHPCITCKTTYYWDSSKTLEKEEYLGELKFTTKGVDERFTYKRWVVTIKKLDTLLVYEVFKNRKQARIFLETEFEKLTTKEIVNG
jgi:Ni,Fe-hydrogenase I small subunit